MDVPVQGAQNSGYMDIGPPGAMLDDGEDV